jgi:hypothetical protein
MGGGPDRRSGRPTAAARSIRDTAPLRYALRSARLALDPLALVAPDELPRVA